MNIKLPLKSLIYIKLCLRLQSKKETKTTAMLTSCFIFIYIYIHDMCDWNHIAII